MRLVSWLPLYLAESGSLGGLNRRGRNGRQAKINPEEISATLQVQAMSAVDARLRKGGEDVKNKWYIDGKGSERTTRGSLAPRCMLYPSCQCLVR